MKIDPRKSEVAQEEKSATEVKWMSRRSYLAALAGAGAGVAGWRWVRSRELEDGTPWPLRRVLEGWSLVVQWVGATLADFAARYPPVAGAGYVSLATPDGGYYVGLDIESALHPQTLLCYEMNGSPLTLAHGAPLRLAVPVKYGIKHLKRIGTLAFTWERPPDYWAEQGYDYYSGH